MGNPFARASGGLRGPASLRLPRPPRVVDVKALNIQPVIVQLDDMMYVVTAALAAGCCIRENRATPSL